MIKSLENSASNWAHRLIAAKHGYKPYMDVAKEIAGLPSHDAAQVIISLSGRLCRYDMLHLERCFHDIGKGR